MDTPTSRKEQIAMKVRTKQIVVFVVGVCVGGWAAGAQSLPNLYPFPNATGWVATYNINNQPIDLSGPFFQSLGSNGRSCASCHLPAQGWSISPDEVRA